MDINTEGIQALILTFIKSLANLDLKALDFDFLGDLESYLGDSYRMA